MRFLQHTVHKDYPFLFKKTTAKAFDEAIEEFYKAIPEMQDHEVLVGFGRIIGMFKYGHTRVSFSESPVPYQQLPLNIYQLRMGLYINGAHKDYEVLVGAKITEVEGKPINQVLEAIYPVVPAENEQFFKAYGGFYMVVPEVLHAQRVTETLKNKIAFTLEKNGKTFTTEVAAGKPQHDHLEYGEIKPGTAIGQGQGTRQTTRSTLKTWRKSIILNTCPMKRLFMCGIARYRMTPARISRHFINACLNL